MCDKRQTSLKDETKVHLLIKFRYLETKCVHRKAAHPDFGSFPTLSEPKARNRIAQSSSGLLKSWTNMKAPVPSICADRMTLSKG